LVATRGKRNLDRRLLQAALVVAVVGGLTLLGWTWRHPHAFHESGGWGITAEKTQVGETVYVGMSYPQGREGGHVLLRSGHPNFDSGAEIAEVEILLCTIDPGARIGAIGSYVGDRIHRDCSALVPIEGQRIDLQYEPLRQQVVVGATLTHRGSVTISDITLDYDYGWQRGSQRIGGQIVMSTEAIETSQ
jgi:hypothetical protein